LVDLGGAVVLLGVLGDGGRADGERHAEGQQGPEGMSCGDHD
jgi:hypothetical protein